MKFFSVMSSERIKIMITFFFVLNLFAIIFVCVSWKPPTKLAFRDRSKNHSSKELLKSKWLKGAIATTLGATLLQANPPLPLISARSEAFAVTRGDNNAQIGISVLQGRYSDPNHPNCLRDISVKVENLENIVTIRGSDQEGSKEIWTLKAVEKTPGEILVDFSPKGGPKDLLGVYDSTTASIKVCKHDLRLQSH